MEALILLVEQPEVFKFQTFTNVTTEFCIPGIRQPVFLFGSMLKKKNHWRLSSDGARYQHGVICHVFHDKY